ncbi:hypothetical protein [Sphingomonas sp. DT-204]|uniref:hypothetical protein n=1 Tax=Sphingomonas sp. DT-204 TaxID=3396166 RepID=UPI003F1D0672
MERRDAPRALLSQHCCPRERALRRRPPLLPRRVSGCCLTGKGVSRLGHAGAGNGDPTCHEPDRPSQRSAFKGLAQTIVQSPGSNGSVRITAATDGLESGNLSILAGARP